MKTYQTAGIAGLIAFALCATASSQTSDIPTTVRPPAPVYPKSALDHGVTGCCRIVTQLDADGAPVDSMVFCTNRVFASVARSAMNKARFAPRTPDGKSVEGMRLEMPMQFAANGKPAPSCPSEATISKFIDLTEKFENNPGDPEDVINAREEASRTWYLDFNGNCASEPRRPSGSPADVSSMSRSEWNDANSAIEAYADWYNCRQGVFNDHVAYLKQLLDDSASNDHASPTYWMFRSVNTQVAHERPEIEQRRAMLTAYDKALNTRRSQLESSSRRPDSYASTNRSRRSRDDDGPSEADRFFYERGPGPHQACLANATTYAEQQACMNNWLGVDPSGN